MLLNEKLAPLESAITLPEAWLLCGLGLKE